MDLPSYDAYAEQLFVGRLKGGHENKKSSSEILAPIARRLCHELTPFE